MKFFDFMEEIIDNDLEGKTLNEKIDYLSNVISSDLKELVRKKCLELQELGEYCWKCGKWSLKKDITEEPNGIEKIVYYNADNEVIKTTKKELVIKRCSLCGEGTTYIRRIVE